MSQRFDEVTGRAALGRKSKTWGTGPAGGDAESPQVAASAPDDHDGVGRALVWDEFAGLAGPEFRAWLRQMERLGGCASPVYLVGHTITRDAGTGELLHVFTSASQPYGRFAVGCRNRRESVCPACAFLHHGDTYQIVVSGLAGGKGVPESVAAHPRVFATLTAPGFGAVHRAAGADRARCRPRRGSRACAHGAAMACYERHTSGDALVGTPLCPDCYDYAGAVLWNASVGRLWHDAVIYTGRALAKAAGIPVRQLRAHARVSFAKVAEFQRRGSVHLHAVVRVDGPGGPGDPAPSWATAEVLAGAVAAGASSAHVTVSGRALGFGPQLDAREIGTDGTVSDGAVAGYIAKYVTKGDISSLILPYRVRDLGQIEATPGLSDHGRRLMRATWLLGGVDEFEGLRLRLWAHQAGFRGHILTKSRAYSTTYGALRSARAALGRPELDDGAETVTESAWRLDRIGHTPEQAAHAAGIAANVSAARDASIERARRMKPRAGDPA